MHLLHLLAALLLVLPAIGNSAPLATLQYRVTGTALDVTPAAVSVPKGIPGSVLVSVVSGGSTNNPASRQLAQGAYVEAILRGPGLPEPRRLVAAPNAPLLLPVLNLVGDYQLDGIRLVDGTTGETRMEGSPSSVPVRVFDEVLISRVTSRPLTIDEIQEKGIFIDDSNFRAIEFEVAFVLDGKTIPITFPVVSPKFTDSTELIPAAELEARLAEAAVLNQQIGTEVVQLPPEFETANLNIQVQGINFQAVDDAETPDLDLTIPPIPALMVIPGNIGFLNQFFSVQIFTENGAPIGSGLSVSNIQAQLTLPPGPDRLASTNYAQPGDDPLRFARIGPDKIIQPVQTILKPGPDGKLGTADDVGRLQPGESGQAEFLVEGLQEGLHLLDLDLTADLAGLAAGVVKVKGKAAGSVLVRNPRFSIAFAHPRTVRTGEPYEASVTILNTGVTPANLVSVTLNRNSISGATFESGQGETVELGTILPGQTATATYRLRSQRTGAISFSNLSTSDDSTVGRFRFSMGVDERGVALSPDSLALPDFVNELPVGILAAANRVLGQALSVATAGQLPEGVKRVPKSIITQRVIELAEAGQRVRYGDPLARVLPDLLRDWQGGRNESPSFDQILRETQAGAEWRAALFGAIESADGLDGTERLAVRSADYAGLGQAFAVGAGDSGELEIELAGETNRATAGFSQVPFSMVYEGTNGGWAVTALATNAVLAWHWTNSTANADISALVVQTNGTARHWRWQLPTPSLEAVYRFALNDPTGALQVDLDNDGVADSTLPGQGTDVAELPPLLIAVEQDLEILAGRPGNPCGGPPYRNYGTVLAVVFSKPVSQATAGGPESYQLDGDNGANSVQIQPSGRVALLNLRKGVSALRPRTLTLTNVTDLRGNPLSGGTMAVHSVEPGTEVPFTGGVVVRGRVLKGDGMPAVGVPVTLTMYDQFHGSLNCEDWIRRVSQVFTDNGGNFDFDFVMAGIPYSISASDTTGLSDEAIRVILDSTVKGEVDRQHIADLANSTSSGGSLLGLLAAGSLPEAIAKVEGIDRAVVRDLIQLGSSREGQTVPIALRFRGRASVIGQVVAADGVTPLPNAAVNLYPDPDSRELGRGVFSDANGLFAFFGVPLGVYSVEVTTSDRRMRTVAGLLDTPGQTAKLTIAVPSVPVAVGTVRGQVFEADNLTPHGNGRVFIGDLDGDKVKNVVRIVNVGADGFWEAEGVPVKSYDLVAVTFDGKRKGVRRAVTPVDGTVIYANITLENITRVYGRVQFDDGRPAPNALVAGGVALVRSDALGNFELEGVPVGRRTISAGLERNPAAGIDFPRLGSASMTVIAGADNYVVVKLRPAGRIFGKVVNANGQPMPRVRVAIPLDGGFYWTDADAQGNYFFENLGLGNYTVSAPANAVAPQLNESELLAQVRSGDEEQILAAFEEAVRVFVGADDPLITGEHQNFRPSTWGYTSARIRFDGESVNADVRYIVQGTISGKVLNHQGVPIGVRVRLTGLGPTPTGAPATTLRGERDTDPATGAFSFPGQLLAGPWTVQAASPFYPIVIKASGFTTEIDPNVTNVILQFPPNQEVNGRIAGSVFYPDGTQAGGGVRVKINISDDYEIQTDTNGFFDTQIAFPALGRSYVVEAFDPGTGLKGRGTLRMTPGITNLIDIHLLSRESRVVATVLRGNGLPAAGAEVELDHGSYPGEAPLNGVADAQGRVVFEGLWEGSYAVIAQFSEAATRVFARAGGSAGPGGTLELTLRLGATGAIQGNFVEQDGITPIEGAQVKIGNLGFANTDSNGFFRFDGVPLGTHAIASSDPVTGISARTTATLTFADQVQTVRLVEATLGEVNGLVQNSYGSGFAACAQVKIQFSDGVTPSRTVTTDPNGRYSFPGSPMGGFTVSATFRLPGGRQISGTASGLLRESAPTVSADIALAPLAVLPVQVVRSDGASVATNTRVRISGPGSSIELDTDASGRIEFRDLLLGNYTLRAISQVGGELRNGITLSTPVAQRGTNPVFVITLPGTGRVQGQVLASDGTTPQQNAEVTLRMQRAPFSGVTDTALTDASGRFNFADIATGDYLVTAASLSLAASINGTISSNAEVDEITLRLGDSGSVLGRVVRADGVTPAGGVDVVIEYASQSANPGRAFFRTATDGLFAFDNVPVGVVHVSSVAASFGGIIDFNITLSTNGQSLDLGSIRFDEALPAIVQVTPPDTSTGVAITVPVDLWFSEALATNSLKTNGIFIRSVNGTVASSLSLLADSNGIPSLVRITPKAPLTSLQTYEVVVLAGDLPGPGGTSIGSGPRDLVGRPMAAPFMSHFTTADNDPPVLLSLFPSNNAVQIDPRAVPRLSFNEPLRSTGFVFTVSGPGGVVPGQAAVGVNGQVLSFVPAGELHPNAIYTLSVSNVFDLAGNRAAGEPFLATFSTLDTVGPAVGVLRIASNAPPVAGATVFVEALLATNETGASVRFTQDFSPLGNATNSPYRAAVKLPSGGSTTMRAIATDQYGNDGPFAELVITVQQAQPPVIQFTLVSPTNGPAPTGGAVIVDVAATGDTAITNLTALAVGAATGTLLATNTSSLRVQGIVSTNAGPGQTVQIYAQATDSLGLSSGQQVFNVAIRDATPPAVSIVTPPDQAIAEPGSVVPINIQLGDNFGVTNVQMLVAGAFRATNQFAIAPAVTNGSRVLDLNVPTSAPTNGEAVQLSLIARDAAGNVSATASRSLRMPDRVPPVLLSATPTNGATRQSLWLPAVVFDFDQALDPLTVSNNVLVTNSAGVATPFSVSLANSNRRLQLSLPHPLPRGATFTNVLLPGITDVAGNLWRNTGGSGVSTAGMAFTFATADIGGITPTNGARFLTGQSVPVNVPFDPGLGAGFFRFQINSNAPVQVFVPINATNVTAQVPIPTNASSAVLYITASDTAGFSESLALTPINLNISAPSSDTDGDGLPDSWEIANGLDPFVNDAALDPDSDGLKNSQELAAGTDPHNPDTDGDGLLDGADPNPLNPVDGLRPTVLTFDIAGIANHQNVDQNYGDRVTNAVMGTFSYGGTNPRTPNIAVSYGTQAPALWTTGYGNLTNVLIEDQDNSGVLTVTLSADTGYLVNLHRFDLAAYTSAFSTDPAISVLQVLNKDGVPIYTVSNLVVSRTGATPVDFTPPLSQDQLTVRVDARNLGGLNDDIALDNLRFSQSVSSNLPPVIDIASPIEVIQGAQTNIAMSATDVDGNLRSLQVREWSQDDTLRLFDVLRFNESAGGDLVSATNLAILNGSLALRHAFTNAVQFVLTATDSEGLSTTRTISVVTLQDLDRDGIPDRDDPDIDGDGVSNAQESLLASDPLKPDTDGDGIPDNEEIAAGIDGFVTSALNGDTDGDGVSDGFEVALGLNPTNGGDTSGTVVISNRTVTVRYGFHRAGTLILTNGAVLTHENAGLPADVAVEPGLDLIVSNLVVDATSRIDVTARGYLGARSGANTGDSGRTFGNTTTAASTRRNGGGYGGIGGIGQEPNINFVYGSFEHPSEFGSGGGSDSGAAGNGGGRIRIVANQIVLQGQLLANGGNGSTYAGGGGGGGIWISTATLEGDGVVRANGGSSGGQSAGGGGGRIAIYCSSLMTLNATNVQALGGQGGENDGTPGTVYLQQNGGLGALVIANASTNNHPTATPLVSLSGRTSTALDSFSLVDRKASFNPGALVGLRLRPNMNSTRTYRIIGNGESRILTDPADGPLTEVAVAGDHYQAVFSTGSLIARDGATIEVTDGNRDLGDRRGLLSVENLELTEHARLTHPIATTLSQFGLELSVTNAVAIDATSRLDVSGRGYLGAHSGGNASDSGRTAGNTITGGSTRRNGGSYGGLGAIGTTEQFVNQVYGSYFNPNEPGSGGGSDLGAAGNGGGLVRIDAAALNLEGQILADGGNGSTYAGGGSGGAIRIATSVFTGDGTIHANGGNAGSQSGGGGGGRVAIFYDTSTFPLSNLQANGGSASSDGGTGTIYTRQGTNAAVVVVRDTGRETPLPDTNPTDHLLVDGATVSATNLTLASLVLTNGAVLTHPGAGASNEFRLNIDVGTLTISADSRIDVSGRGYLGAHSGANASDSGRTLGNTTDGGSTRRNGGSYGGLGAIGTTGRESNPIYGLYADPNEPGSGGGSDLGDAGNGGGLVRITANTLNLEGQILANGLNGSTYAAGGSGGGVRVNVGTLTGAGVIHANGGGAGSQSGGGGGGRVAIYYTSSGGFSFTNLQAIGGEGGAGHGASGTIFLKQGSNTPQLVIRGNGRETPMPRTLSGEHVVVDDATVSATNFTLTTLVLTNGAVLTHPGAELTNEFRLTMNVGILSISADSRIDVSGRGYLGAHSGANASDSGRTLGNTTDGGSTRRNGGSYGGLGAIGSTGRESNPLYGLYADPNEPGSGGGSDSGEAGNGGGLLRITANTLHLEGQILANGLNGSTYAAGGSGGGVRLDVGTLTGGGVIRANGGGAGSQSGGGGGGRIAIYYTSASGSFPGNLQAFGGIGSTIGAAGTIYTRQASNTGVIVVRSNGRETPLPPTIAGEHLLLDNATVSATNLVVSTLTLTNGAVLTHPGAGLANEYRLVINAAAVVISTNSRIDVSERGYLGGGSGGNGDTARTLGNALGSTRRNGGSYGGVGAFGSETPISNDVYGSFRNPDELGSGGGSDSGAGGNGGGLLRLTANSLLLDGRILANGGNGSTYAGGGSGGGIRIETVTLAGGGEITAIGGSSGSVSGTGGGGRIAIFYQDATQFAFTNMQATAGYLSGMRQGTPGTIYLQSPSTQLGQLFIDAKGTNFPSRGTPIYSLAGRTNTSVGSNYLLDTNAVFAPGSLIGLELNPNPGQGATFTVVGNTTNMIFTDPSDGDMRSVAAAGDGLGYSAANVLDYLGVQGGAIVELADGDQARLDRRGRLRAANAAILDGSQLTHPQSATTSQFGLELIVDGTLRVDGGSRIDVSGRGYAGAHSSGNSSDQAFTLGNTLAGGSTRRNGGSHGGSGAFGNAGGTVNSLYGTAESPSDPGSGGGSDSGPGGNGGGVIRVIASVLELEGALRADGDGGSTYGGGGSGGAVWLTVGSIEGAGTVTANGGGSGGASGGGGGGRIAVHYQQDAGFAFTNLAAVGGNGAGVGLDGTVFLLQTNFTLPAKLARFVISGIHKLNPVAPLAVSRPAGPITWVLECRGPVNTPLAAEISTDLVQWRSVASSVRETAPGSYQITIQESSTAAFFRLREMTKQQAAPTPGEPTHSQTDTSP